MTLIETKTLGTAAASIEFTSIPQTFTDLVILSSLRSDGTNGVDVAKLEFNGVTTDYSRRVLQGDGSSTFSFTSTTAALSVISDGLNTANTFGNSTCYIPNYTSSNFKSFSVDSVSENNGATGYQSLYAQLWSNTSPITSFLVSVLVASNFVAGSTISLYGITKGSDGIVTVS
jgi:hypothetical protein